MCILLQTSAGEEITDDCGADHTDIFVVRLLQLEEEMRLWDENKWGDKIVSALCKKDNRCNPGFSQTHFLMIFLRPKPGTFLDTILASKSTPS